MILCSILVRLIHGRKMLFLFSLCVAFASHSKAQDIINTTDGKILNVRILDVGVNEIKYKNNADSLDYSISKSDVKEFKYGMPAKDSTASQADYVPEKRLPKTKSSMYMKGAKDAELYYTKYRAASS